MWKELVFPKTNLNKCPKQEWTEPTLRRSLQRWSQKGHILVAYVEALVNIAALLRNWGISELSHFHLSFYCATLPNWQNIPLLGLLVSISLPSFLATATPSTTASLLPLDLQNAVASKNDTFLLYNVNSTPSTANDDSSHFWFVWSGVWASWQTKHLRRLQSKPRKVRSKARHWVSEDEKLLLKVFAGRGLPFIHFQFSSVLLAPIHTSTPLKKKHLFTFWLKFEPPQFLSKLTVWWGADCGGKLVWQLRIVKYCECGTVGRTNCFRFEPRGWFWKCRESRSLQIMVFRWAMRVLLTWNFGDEKW